MSANDTHSKITQFTGRLEGLDPGSRARLKRSAGQSLAEASHETLGLFYSLLPYGVPPYHEPLYFLVASLYPLADGGGRGDLGAALRRAVVKGKNDKGFDRRMVYLLDADETQLPFRLRQAIHNLQSGRVRVNWPGLLEDLLNWGHPDRFVQRKWARSYFASEEPVKA